MAIKNNNVTDEGQKNLDEDRKTIIEIIDYLLENTRFNTVTLILNHLNYPALPGRGNSNSETIISRLRHPQKNERLKNQISKIKYSDLLHEFKNKFSDFLVIKEIKTKNISPKHHDYYFYYYESYSEKTDDYYVKFAIMAFNRKSIKGEWKTGNIYYINDYNIANKIFKLTRIEPPKPNTDVLFFSAVSKKEKQVNFFTLKIMDRPMESRGIIPLTYSVLETQYKYPCAGTAILEKTSYDECVKKINDLELRNKDNKHPGVSDLIINILHQHKYVLKDKVFDKPLELSTVQGRVLDKVKGIWSGIHLRTDFDDSYEGNKKGGICKFVLKISNSGECEFCWGKDEYKVLQSKTGFVEFPFGDSSVMKISLEFLKKEKTYKLMIFLSAAPIEKKNFVYKGVISGWMSIDRKIYTSAIYLKRISTMTDPVTLNRVLKRENPRRISKTLTNEIAKINPNYIRALKKAEKEFIAQFTNSMPSRFRASTL